MSSAFYHRVGFMQGRLSTTMRGRIHCFPEHCWQNEILLAGQAGFAVMEWTLASQTWEVNPLVSARGRKEILSLLKETELRVPSLTGDNFRERPFYKATGKERAILLAELDNVLEASAEVGISMVLIPLVDNGSLKTSEHEDVLCDELWKRVSFLNDSGMQILFESDYPPARLKTFISRFAPRCFGLKYDIGSSTSFGFSPLEELSYYGDRISNVHVKDRRNGGGTLPLGMGSAYFEGVFERLETIGYKGNYILQTAKATDDDHLGLAVGYRDRVVDWLER